MIVTDTSLLAPLLRARCVEVVSAFGVLRVSKDVERELLRVAPECRDALERARSKGLVEVLHVPGGVRREAQRLDGKYRLGVVDCIGIAWAKTLDEDLAMEDRHALECAEREGVKTMTLAAALLAHRKAGKLDVDGVRRLALRIELDGDHTWGARDRALLGV